MRYFFDVRDAEGVTPDEEGVECASPEAAVREAAVAAAAMSADFAGTAGVTLRSKFATPTARRGRQDRDAD